MHEHLIFVMLCVLGRMHQGSTRAEVALTYS